MGKVAGNGSSPVYVHEIAVSVPSAIATGVFASLKNSGAAFLGAGAMILRAYLRITTASTGAGTIDIGVTAVSATTASDTIFDGLSTAATGIFDSMDGTDNGTNGIAKPQVLAEDSWITLAEASGDLAGLVGTLYVEYTYL